MGTALVITRLQQKFDDIDTQQLLQFSSLAAALILLVLTGLSLLDVYSTVNEPPQNITANQPELKPTLDYNARTITNSNLFGQSSGDSLANQSLPETRLQLELRGAFTSTNPKFASAIIKGPDGESRSFKVDSRVYGAAQLHQVYADRVVLSRNGQLETLYFPEPGTDASTIRRPANSSNAAANYDIPSDARKLIEENMSLSEIQQASKQLSSSAMTPEQRQALIRQRLQDLRNRANRNNK